MRSIHGEVSIVSNAAKVFSCSEQSFDQSQVYGILINVINSEDLQRLSEPMLSNIKLC